jgi:hypothetical protein
MYTLNMLHVCRRCQWTQEFFVKQIASIWFKMEKREFVIVNPKGVAV